MTRIRIARSTPRNEPNRISDVDHRHFMLCFPLHAYISSAENPAVYVTRLSGFDQRTLAYNAVGSICWSINSLAGTPEIIEAIHVQSMKRNQLSFPIFSNVRSSPNGALKEI
ncbi:hypothetical protein H8B02_41405 [Bradyrhizobium sp. Pear77]|uniref:hypothetical protein n=1 Tax=Bradyrhizobium altum TaxID=1571202 RepID=UPI001E57A261|nr:hypothetical protein [Bradyrhizobium altum]MCC8959635.1 hypothetical protein [Bradyrhizobium altum]